MKPYFFIPASKLDKVNSIKKRGISDIIIDFEDAILSIDKNKYFDEFINLSDYKNYWIRVPTREDFDDEVDYSFLEEIKKVGVNKIILPKLKSSEELITLIAFFKGSSFIILIEHPRLLLEIKNLFYSNSVILGKIKGIGLGSHDLMTFLGAEHELDQLDYPRKELLYLAKSYDIDPIDIASMNLNSEQEFIAELEYGIKNGYNRKFLIHPKQYDWMMKYSKLEEKDLLWAKEIVSKLPKDYNGGSIAPFVLNNKIIEKPHVMRALEILRKEEYGK